MSASAKSVLVTGGAGFIGSHLVDVLLAHDHCVCVLDNLSYGKRKFLPPDGLEFRFIRGDILDSGTLLQLCDDFRPLLVYHLAAIHHIPTCESEPSFALRVNVEGTESVLMAASKTSSVKRFVFASSGALYDVIDASLAEDNPVVPQNIYSVSKVAGELLVRINAQKTGIQGIAARIFNAVGPRETNAHLVPDILAQVVRGQRKIRLGNLEPRRSYIHVKDIAEGLYALGMTDLKAEYDVFNVGDEQESSVKEVLELLSKLLGYPLVPVQTKEKIRESDKLSQKADIRKIWQEVGWRPRRSLRAALQAAIEEVGLCPATG